MFCIYISIWMGLHPIYAAAEAESSRYLDIYILIVCLHFTIFKNDKIHRPLRVKPTVHLLSGAAHCCVQGPVEWSFAAGWLVVCQQREVHPAFSSHFGITSGHRPCFCSVSPLCLRRTVSEKVTIHCPCTFSLWPLCWDCQQGCQLEPFKKAQICCGNNEIQI